MEQSNDDRARIERLEQILAAHDSRITLLENLMVRVVAITDVAIQLLQRREGETDDNGTA